MVDDIELEEKCEMNNEGSKVPLNSGQKMANENESPANDPLNTQLETNLESSERDKVEVKCENHDSKIQPEANSGEKMANVNESPLNDSLRTQLEVHLEPLERDEAEVKCEDHDSKIQPEANSEENTANEHESPVNDSAKIQLNSDLEPLKSDEAEVKYEINDQDSKIQPEANSGEKISEENNGSVTKSEMNIEDPKTRPEINLDQKRKNESKVECEINNDDSKTEADADSDQEMEIGNEIESEVGCEMNNHDSKTKANANSDQEIQNESESDVECEMNDQETNSESKISYLEKNIIRQVEYYFGDFNLPRDKFLQENLKLDDGWIPISVLLSFKRISNMTASQDVIVGALLKSRNNLLEISEDRSKIRRCPSKPLPELRKHRREKMSHTVYAKGFPLDMELGCALDFFKNFDAVEHVEMRSYFNKKTKKGGFKGSVFVTFAKQVFAQKFMSLEKVTFQDRQLIRMWQCDYFEMKRTEKAKKYSQEYEKPIFRPPIGTVINVEGLTGEITKHDIKAAFLELTADIAFIDYGLSDKVSRVRLHAADNVTEVLKKVSDGKIKIGDVDASVRLLEGEEESEYLDKVVENIRNYSKKQGYTRRGGRNGYPGRGGMNGRKCKVSAENVDFPSKQQNTVVAQDA